LSVVLALSSTVIALFAARQSNEAAQSAAQASALQNADSQLTSDISSLDQGDSAAQATQILLTGKEITSVMSMQLSTSEARQEAYSDYTTTLEAISIYIHTNASPTSTSASTSFGLGYGTLPPGGYPINLQVAADQIVRLLQLHNQVNALSFGTPALDLSNDEFYGLDLAGINLSWVSAYMRGVDLRGAVLERAVLSSRDYLALSHLQCADMTGAELLGADLEDANLSGADLAGADLRGADLAGADLRGAYVLGANFSGARIIGTTLTTLYGRATGLPPGIATSAGQPLSLSSCLASKSYGDPSALRS
jgi:uncharacterized protein YjbI with pentapeptide repeats